MTDGWNKGWNAVAAKSVNNNHTISLSLSLSPHPLHVYTIPLQQFKYLVKTLVN
jgi:hypothetical protein